MSGPDGADKALVRRFLEAFGDADKETLQKLVREDVRWWVPPSVAALGLARPLDGWADIPWFGGPGSGSFRPGTTEWVFHHVVAEDGLVAVHMNRRAVGANGKPYDNEYHWLFRCQDGQIAEVWEVLDTAHAFSLLEMGD
jgi:ketosteroid isomerase-like protein